MLHELINSHVDQLGQSVVCLLASPLACLNNKYGHVSTRVVIAFCVLTMHAATCVVTNSNRKPGTACQCLPGFKGEITWDGDSTTSESACTATNCTDFVESLANGDFTKSNGDLHGSVATFTCKDRYILFGPSSITCDAPIEDAAWPSVIASCIGVLFAVVLHALTHAITN